MGDKVRRVVTTHDAIGHAVVRIDEKVALAGLPGENLSSAVIWTTGRFPADNSVDAEDGPPEDGMSLNGGSALRLMEFGPGFTSPVQRSLSIDYLCVLSGELEMELDGGELVRLYQGDVLVQRGTGHSWRNPSQDTPCRVIVSMVEALRLPIGGGMLRPTP